MKVKELIEKLKELDQEKEIKIVEADGWEFELGTHESIKIEPYINTRQYRKDGSYYYDVNDNTDSEDFYLLHSKY